MPFNIGGPELIFILVLVLIVFGAGRLPEVFGQLGKGIRTFRDESASTGSSVATAPTAPTAPSSPVAPSAPVAPAAATTCAKCQSPLPPSAKFCPSCGTPV